MTDIMKLADDYAAKNRAVANVIEQGTSGELIEADGDKKRARAALKSAIEALQEENALLEGTLESRGRNIAALQAENERLKAEKAGLEHVKNAFADQMQALQAKLDALEKQEPIYQYQMGDGSWIDQTKHSYDYNRNHAPNAVVRIVYAAPKALAPSREVIGRYMADKGFYLSKEALDGLMLKLEGIGGTP